jgi:Stage II sporulation protein E (SpoIIE)/PAS fold
MRACGHAEADVESLVEHRLALALTAARLGTWTWDMASGTTVWDVRLEELHGLPPGGFGGTFEDWLASLYPEDRAECLARVERALADPGPYVLLHRTIWPDGSVHYIECRGMVLTDQGGVPTGTTGVAIDVTQRERNQAVAFEALAHEREVVGVLQRALLPTYVPTHPNVQVARRYLPAIGSTSVGGDWYAIVPFDDKLGVAIGDVAGHGLEAVADMAAARFSLRALALHHPSEPEGVLERLNESLTLFERDMMITALYGILDPGARTWQFANAGHPPALVRDVDGNVAFIDHATDPPLGVSTTYRKRSEHLSPGATLVLYTDGLFERRNESIDDGLDRLLVACLSAPEEPEALCDHLLAEMIDDCPAEDDVALVVLKLT